LGSALCFGGAGDNEFTIECWINPLSLDGAAIYTYDGWDTGALHFLWNWIAPGLQFAMDGNSINGTPVFDSDPPIPLNQWTHVVAVYTGRGISSNVVAYVNGLSVGTNVFTSAVSVDFEPAEIGACSDGGRFFDGLIDEFAIYTNALSADRVLAHYDAALRPPQAPTLSITNSGKGTATLSWSANGFVLQMTTNLNDASHWVDVPNVTNRSINVSFGGASTFYRLKSQ
jgi:hypothetical protein